MSSSGDKDKRKGKSYEEKSERLYAWSALLRSLSKILWALVVVILLAGLGKLFIFKSDKDVKKPAEPVKKPVVATVDWSKVDKEIRQTMETARKQAEVEAAGKLDAWIADNMTRVDEDFLEWYFSYWTQQKLGLDALLSQVLHWVDSDSPTAAEKITQTVQQEFSNRVIRPVIAQKRIESIIDETIQKYSSELGKQFSGIPEKYDIKPADWDRYIEDISILVRNVEANRQTPLTLKTLVGAAAGGTVAAFLALRPLIVKIGSKISARFAAKTAAKMASKTGGKVAARAGGKFVGTIVAIGIIIWDVWDHHSTRQKAQPVLRQNIYDYFQELKKSILHDPEYGMITIIYEMERSISTSLANK